MKIDTPEVYCLGSSSSGNAYIFKFIQDDWSHQILVEAGFPYKELVKRAILQGTRLSECESCIITHCHGDHAVGARIINGKGIQVFASKGTLEDKRVGIRATEFNTLEEWTPKFIAPSIEVLPFLVEHDAPEPMGFIIRDTYNKQNILFINDAKTVKADLSKVPIDLCFIESNYSDQPMHIEYNNAKKAGDVVLINRYSRIFHQHMGLYGTKTILKKLNMTRCKAIFLMHLSDRNARENEMREEVGKLFPHIPVYICGKNGGFH